MILRGILGGLYVFVTFSFFFAASGVAHHITEQLVIEAQPMERKPMPVVYVAGPYRASNRAGVELNIQSARLTGLHCCLKGWSPLIPHANTGGLDEIAPAIPDQFWLDATLELMRRCDAVVLCPGYSLSNGTAAEVIDAQRLGMRVYWSVDEMPPADTWHRLAASGS
ncbi:MAG: DUF4406 domain-containing protein [Pseudomonas sp.]|nr:DUF4406 domain-containing protein [Pseudomonas sp.]